ncbi:hypothetical protein ACS0TY_006333 [Phlomoides rotata]
MVIMPQGNYGSLKSKSQLDLCFAVGRIENVSYPSDMFLSNRDRERAQARNGNKSKNQKDDGLTPDQRRERDAKALQEKAARKAGGGGNANGGGHVKNDRKI